ncbi:GFA family protein [Candidatus Kaiserbacteria bacterium]|nr:GFA family protein [Candidatus Kaiserbacteria bacterium]
MNYAEGGCYCGKVQFKVPMPAAWAGHCHCTQCQRLHGAAFVTWIGFKTPDYEIIDREGMFSTFSTGYADHGFCKNCGSPFYFKYTKTSDIIGPEWLEHVYFARPNFTTDPGIEPTHNIFYKTHAQWIENIFNLPKGDR